MFIRLTGVAIVLALLIYYATKKQKKKMLKGLYIIGTITAVLLLAVLIGSGISGLK